jgi:cation transport ATPase
MAWEGKSMSKAEMKTTVEVQYDRDQFLLYAILFFFFFAMSLATMIIGFSKENLYPIGWGGLAMMLWISLLFSPFLIFFGHRFFHYVREAENYVPVTALFTIAGTSGFRYGSYFSAHFDWEGKSLSVDTHSLFYFHGLTLFDLPKVAEYANKENKIAFNPKDGTIVVVGLM